MLTILPNQPVKFRSDGESFFADLEGCYKHFIPYANKSECADTVSFQVGIDNAAYEDSQVGWALKDKDGVFVYVETDGSHVEYNEAGTIAKVEFSWDDVLPDGYSCEPGCYNICVFDSSDENIIYSESTGDPYILIGDELNTNPDFNFNDLIIDGDFSGAGGWNTDPNWTIGAGVASHTPGSADSISQSSGVVIGATSYQVEYDQLNTTAGATQVVLGGTSLSPEGGNTTHKEIGVPTVDSSFFINANSSFDGDIDNVKCYAINDIYDASGGGVLFTIGQDAILSSNALLNLPGIIGINKSYRLTFDIVRTAGSLAVIVDGNTVQSVSSTASYDVIFDSGSDTDILFDGNATCNMVIRNISIKEVITLEDALNEGDFNISGSNGGFCSEPYDVQESHACTKILRWRNDENSFGFEYVDFPNFYHYIRLNCKLGRPLYQVEQKNYENSQAHNRILRAQVDKLLELWIEHLPEYVHDAMSIGIKHDDFEILDEDRSDSYIAYVSSEEDYEPNWEDDELPLARVRTTMKLKTPSSSNENPNC